VWGIDDVFPNFTTFVLVLMPLAMAVTVIGWLIRKYASRSRLGRGGGHKFDEILGYIPALYFLWPTYDIIQYFYGYMSWNEIMARLFTTHLMGFTVLMLLAGIGQVIYFIFSWRPKKVKEDDVVVVGHIIGRVHRE
jgi:hypothetical protein